MKTASWIIREKESRRIVAETFNPKVVAALNTERYEAVPIGTHLASLNKDALHTSDKP